MKKTINLFFSMFLFTGILSFGQSIPRIDLNKFDFDSKFTVTNLGKEFHYIPLETNENCLIGRVRDIIITEDWIFVKDPEKVLQFDISGKFIRQVGREGNGPGEYNRVYSMAYNIHSNKLWIADIMRKKILEYSTQGKFSRSFTYTKLPSQMMFINANEVLILYDDHISLNEDDDYLMAEIFSSDFNSKKKFFSSLKHQGDSGGKILLPPMEIPNSDSEIYFQWSRNDTVFELRNNNLVPILYFNYQRYKIPFEEITVQCFLDKNWGGDYLYLQEILKYQDEIFFHFQFHRNDYWGFSSLTNNNPIVLGDKGKPTKMPDSIDQGPGFWPFDSYKDKLWDFFLPIDIEDLDTWNKKAGLQVNEEDNPIIRILE